MSNPALSTVLAEVNNPHLRAFVSYNAYERGHSGGEDEVIAHAIVLVEDVKAIDSYITLLESCIDPITLALLKKDLTS